MTFFNEVEKDSFNVRIPDGFKKSTKIDTEVERKHGHWGKFYDKKTSHDYYTIIHDPHRHSQKSKSSVIRTNRIQKIDDEYYLEETEKPLFKEVTRSNQKMIKTLKKVKHAERHEVESDDEEAIRCDVDYDINMTNQ
jgi:hypothetical protein